MALNPNLLSSLPDALVDMYGLVEIDILQDMARRISTYDYFIPAALHQNQKLQELGMVQEEIIARLAALTGQTQSEIVALLSEASAEAIEDDVEYYTRAEVYEPSKVNTEALHAQLNSGLLQTEQAFFNITRTTANTASKQFERALDRAWTQINTGGFDATTAIRQAIKDLADAGVGAVEYKSGRIDNIEVAVRRAVVTGANQTAVRTQEVLADELEIDLVEVTAHGGARPAHAKWQGKVFSRKGEITIEGVTYEDLRKATGYGTAGGLCGVNCRHNFHPYVHGTSRAYSEKDLEKLDEKKIEYNGEMYTEYEASQIQRSIEREIRKHKRTVEALESVGENASAERKKLREAQKSYTDFTEQTGMRKQSARTQIGTAKAERAVRQANAAASVTNSTKKDIQEKREKKMPAKDAVVDDSITEDDAITAENNETEERENNEAEEKEVLTNSDNDDTITEEIALPQIDSDDVLRKAKDGIRNKGIYDDALKKTESRLRKSIRSHEKQVAEHIEKLKNPAKYDAEWDTKTEQQKNGLLKKWRKDMQRNAEQAEIERRVLDERTAKE